MPWPNFQRLRADLREAAARVTGSDDEPQAAAPAASAPETPEPEVAPEPETPAEPAETPAPAEAPAAE